MHYPTIKQLRYFIALVEHNHFGKAAESCFVSQSAFSVAIKELESTLNGRLVDRTNKSVTVTNLGRETYAQAQVVMQELSLLVDISQGNKIPLSGKLSLGIIPTIAPFLLTKFIFKLQQKHPKLELYLHEDMTMKLYQKLMQGELDVILVALPYALKNIETLTLFKDKFHLVYNPKSKWVKKQGKTIIPDDESVLLLEDGHCMREHALSACKLKSYDKVSRYAASSVLTLIEMVKSDIGITFLPQMSLDSHLVKQSKIKIQGLAGDSYREIGLIWRKGSSRANEFRLLGDFIRVHHK
ncbi:Hydrogen peroxide-inducible genes activator =_ OxyR [hydrothermal vent metagenome]|uniref:Hydrogen peroxide-inducible genes activator => OxyR n=1 Tax=hydrothermal vent metagenome TaxID=652676 RepID=A0A3B0V7T5_9ZZZZ